MDTREIVSFSREVGYQSFYLNAIKAQHRKGNYHPSKILEALLTEYIRISRTARHRNYLMSSYTFRYSCAAKKLLGVLSRDPACQTNEFMSVLYDFREDISDFRDHLFRLVSTFMSVYEEYRFYLTDNLRGMLAIKNIWQEKLKASEVTLYGLIEKVIASNLTSGSFIDYGRLVLQGYFSQLAPVDIKQKSSAIVSLVRKTQEKSYSQRWMEYELLTTINPYVPDDLREEAYHDVYEDFHVTGKVGAMNILMSKAAIVGRLVANDKLDQFIQDIVSSEVTSLPLVILKVLNQLKGKISPQALPKVLSYVRKQVETGELHTKLLAMSMLIRWKEAGASEKRSFTTQFLGLVDHAMVGVQLQAFETLIEMGVEIPELVKQSAFRKIMHKLDLLYNEESCDSLLKIKKIIPEVVCEEKFRGMLDRLRHPLLLAGKSPAYIYRLFAKLTELVPHKMCVELADFMISVIPDQYFGADASLIVARLRSRLPIDMQTRIAKHVFLSLIAAAEPTSKHYKAVNEYISFFSAEEKTVIFDNALNFVRNYRHDENISKANAVSHYDQLATCCLLLRNHFKSMSSNKQIAMLTDFLVRDSSNPYEQLVFVDFYSIFKANFSRSLVQKVSGDFVACFPVDTVNEIMSHYSY